MNKNLIAFLIPFLILCLLATLFPPTFSYSTFRGFTFLFSSTIHQLSWDILILEYLLILFFSGLLTVIYNRFGSFIIYYFLISILISSFIYFVVGIGSLLFYPSFANVIEKEKSIRIEYSKTLYHSKVGPYILGSELFKVLDSTFNYNSYEHTYGHLISLPDSLFPLPDKYLFPIDEDSLNRVKRNSKYEFWLDERWVIIQLLPEHYSNYVIPYGYSLDNDKLNSEVNSLVLPYLKSYFASLLEFYELKSEYFQSEKEFLKIKSTLQFSISIALFCILILIFILKRNYFKRKFNF